MLIGGLLLTSCQKDSVTSKCLAGIVLNQINDCNGTDGNGLAFLIKVKNHESYDTIATTTLPEAFKVKDSEIYFLVRDPEHPMICNTMVLAPIQLDVYKVSDSNCCENED